MCGSRNQTRTNCCAHLRAWGNAGSKCKRRGRVRSGELQRDGVTSGCSDVAIEMQGHEELLVQQEGRERGPAAHGGFRDGFWGSECTQAPAVTGSCGCELSWRDQSQQGLAA